MILQGASDVIRRSPALTMTIEFQPQRELYDFLRSAGFEICPILPGKEVAPAAFEDMVRIGTCDALIRRP